MDTVGLYISGYRLPPPVDYPTSRRSFKFTINSTDFVFEIPHPDANINLRELLWIKESKDIDRYFRYGRPVSLYHNAEETGTRVDEREWDRQEINLNELSQEIANYISNILNVYVAPDQ